MDVENFMIIPEGMCVIRTAESVVFTCCPPAPLALLVSILKSLRMNINELIFRLGDLNMGLLLWGRS